MLLEVCFHFDTSVWVSGWSEAEVFLEMQQVRHAADLALVDAVLFQFFFCFFVQVIN